MNRFTALGVALAAASEQKAVLVLTDEHEVSGVVRALESAELGGRPLAVQVKLANGAGEVAMSGGGVVKVRGIRSFRPVTVDVVFVDSEGTWVLRTEAGYYGAHDIHDRIRACLHRRPDAEVVYA